MTFSENIFAGTGDIMIKKSSDNSIVETIDITSGQVTGIGTDTINIGLSVTLNNSTGYYIQVAPGALKDAADNAFAGITDTTTWSFTTADVPPTLQTLSPADNSTGVLGNTDDDDLLRNCLCRNW